MKIFLLHDPKRFTECARFSHIGSWSTGKLCQKCQQPTSKLIEPLQIEWEPGSDVVCEFSWCGYLAAIHKALGIRLQKAGFDIYLGSIEYVKPLSKSKEKRVPYPYPGPELRWLLPTKRIPLNEKESDVSVIIDCDDCGQKKYTFKVEGLVIDKTSWNGEKIFQIDQFNRSRAMFITEQAAEEMKALTISNIALSEAGEIQ